MPQIKGWQHNKSAYRSGLEVAVGKQCRVAKVKVEYEVYKIPFIQPMKNRHYTPDFILPNGIVIETKGQFISGDRQKHLWVRDQYPLMELRFVFSNSRAKIYKGAKTSCGQWATKYGFKYADKLIPRSWLTESVNQEWLGQVDKFIKIGKKGS
jgi:hypothetical protein